VPPRGLVKYPSSCQSSRRSGRANGERRSPGEAKLPPQVRAQIESGKRKAESGKRKADGGRWTVDGGRWTVAKGEGVIRRGRRI
jgi:hypothetical protein